MIRYTQKCFIHKNSDELKQFLFRTLGHRNGTRLVDMPGMLIVADPDGVRNMDDTQETVSALTGAGYTDCGVDEKKFRAVASLTDCPEGMTGQLYKNNMTGRVCAYGDFSALMLWPNEWHRMTADEIMKEGSL
jgi:hypothetical protein